MQINALAVETLVNLTTSAEASGVDVHPDIAFTIVSAVLGGFLAILGALTGNPFFLAMSMTAILLGTMNELNDKGNPGPFIEQMIDQKIQWHHLDILHSSVDAIKLNMRRFKSVWQEFEHAPPDNRDHLAENLRHHHLGFLQVIINDIHKFQLEDHAVVSLPDFTAMANMHVLLLAAGIKYGKSWGYPRQHIEGTLMTEFHTITGTAKEAAALDKRNTAWDGEKQRKYEDETMPMHLLTEAIRHGEAMGWSSELLDTWRGAYSAQSVPRQEHLVRLKATGQDYPTYARETYKRGRLMVRPYRPLEGKHNKSPGADEAAALRAYADYDAVMISRVLSFAECWPYALHEFRIPDTVARNLDREIFSGPYGGYGRFKRKGKGKKVPPLGTEPDDKSTEFRNGWDGRDVIPLDQTPWSATRPPPVTLRGENITEMVMYAGEYVQCLQNRWGGRWASGCRGNENYGRPYSIHLEPDELIENVDLRYGGKVETLGFRTSKNAQFGPFGGKRSDKRGEEPGPVSLIVNRTGYALSSIHFTRWSTPQAGIDGVFFGFRPIHLASDTYCNRRDGPCGELTPEK
ncbi:hypothetical protein NLG97_g8473 [Lecanicillium saksenae]|uniref:Uncharacterized protein n=1 Tax=Lecanicillium saksenae TaxID=468837 RepID=A0ACC1QM42_9HYPO|nr:hypothetical protein NLG97_g8473 [Lecanicillium saksenae]